MEAANYYNRSAKLKRMKQGALVGRIITLFVVVLATIGGTNATFSETIKQNVDVASRVMELYRSAPQKPPSTMSRITGLPDRPGSPSGTIYRPAQQLEDRSYHAPTPNAHNQAPSEVDPPVIGHASRPTVHDPDTNPDQPGEGGMFDSNGHYIGSPEQGYLGPERRRAQTLSPSLVDLGGRRPRGAYVSPYADVPTNYSAQLEARSMKIFPSPSQEPQRQQWMADQEQKSIENEINRSKPLIFPVSGRR
jgi:hypothetical protein